MSKSKDTFKFPLDTVEVARLDRGSLVEFPASLIQLQLLTEMLYTLNKNTKEHEDLSTDIAVLRLLAIEMLANPYADPHKVIGEVSSTTDEHIDCKQVPFIFLVNELFPKGTHRWYGEVKLNIPYQRLKEVLSWLLSP